MKKKDNESKNAIIILNQDLEQQKSQNILLLERNSTLEKELQENLEERKRELEIESSKSINSTQLEDLNSQISNLSQEITEKEELISNLYDEVDKSTQLYNTLTIEKKGLLDEISSLRQKVESLEKIKTVSSVSTSEIDHSQLLKFQESVIADLNEKLIKKNAEFEALKLNTNSNVNSQEKQNKQQIREYCNHCENFEHPTQNCPNLTQEKLEEIQRKNKAKVQPPKRDFCVNCKEFGHTSNNCTSEESF